MKSKQTTIAALILSAFALCAHATGEGQHVSRPAATTVCITGNTSSWASGAQTQTYGQTITKLNLVTPAGTTVMDGNVISSASGAGSSNAGNSLAYRETLSSGPRASYVATTGNMNGWAKGSDATSGTGGDMSATGSLTRGASTVNFTSASGFGATGSGLSEGGARQAFSAIIAVGHAAPVRLSPVNPTCSGAGC